MQIHELLMGLFVSHFPSQHSAGKVNTYLTTGEHEFANENRLREGTDRFGGLIRLNPMFSTPHLRSLNPNTAKGSVASGPRAETVNENDRHQVHEIRSVFDANRVKGASSLKLQYARG